MPLSEQSLVGRITTTSRKHGLPTERIMILNLPINSSVASDDSIGKPVVEIHGMDGVTTRIGTSGFSQSSNKGIKSRVLQFEEMEHIEPIGWRKTGHPKLDLRELVVRLRDSSDAVIVLASAAELFAVWSILGLFLNKSAERET